MICLLHCPDFLSSLFRGLFVNVRTFYQDLIICGWSSYLIVRPKVLTLEPVFLGQLPFGCQVGAYCSIGAGLMTISGCLPWHMPVSPERNLLVSCLGNKASASVQGVKLGKGAGDLKAQYVDTHLVPLSVFSTVP